MFVIYVNYTSFSKLISKIHEICKIKGFSLHFWFNHWTDVSTQFWAVLCYTVIVVQVCTTPKEMLDREWRYSLPKLLKGNDLCCLVYACSESEAESTQLKAEMWQKSELNETLCWGTDNLRACWGKVIILSKQPTTTLTFVILWFSNEAVVDHRSTLKRSRPSHRSCLSPDPLWSVWLGGFSARVSWTSECEPHEPGL